MRSSRFPTLLGCALLSLPAFGQQPAPASKTAPASKSLAGNSSIALLHQMDEGFVALFDKVAPSVVIIDTTKKSDDDTTTGGDEQGFDFFFHSPDNDDARKQFRMPEPSNKSEGSGFFVRPDGYIMTNNHVIDGADKITVKLKDGRQFPAKVVGTDERTDIAVVKIDVSGMPVAEYGNSDTLRVGQLVCAIGVPFALDYSFTVGWVSGKGRSGLTSNLTYEDYIQTNAFINPGNSGGPLFDVDGNVIGMNTLINGIGRGLAFAIPSNMLKDVGDQLISTGKIVRPYLGVTIETLDDKSSLRDQIQGIDKGVVINSIQADTPAYKSDLRPADVITAVDGVPVATAKELQKEILKKKIGQVVKLTVWRNGKTMSMAVATGELPGSDLQRPQPEERTEETTPNSNEIYGLTLKDVSKEDAARLEIKQQQGALVASVTADSAAAVSGLQKDDVITEIDSKPVANSEAARKLLQAHDAKKAILLFLERKGQKTYAVLKIDK